MCERIRILAADGCIAMRGHVESHGIKDNVTFDGKVDAIISIDILPVCFRF